MTAESCCTEPYSPSASPYLTADPASQLVSYELQVLGEHDGGVPHHAAGVSLGVLVQLYSLDSAGVPQAELNGSPEHLFSPLSCDAV